MATQKYAEVSEVNVDGCFQVGLQLQEDEASHKTELIKDK